MTVQQLIDRLNRVEDKEMLVFVYENNFEGQWVTPWSGCEEEDDGVGKDSTCKRGIYLERWVTCGDIGDGHVSELSIAWYKEQARQRDGKSSVPSDRKMADKFIRNGYVI